MRRIVNFDDIMVIQFRSFAQSVHYAMKCLPTDIFSRVEEELYKSYPNLKETNNNFLYNGRVILRFKTITENNIINGCIIQIIKGDD